MFTARWNRATQPPASLLAEYANAAYFLVHFSVLQAEGWPLTLCMICFWLQMCTTTTAEGKASHRLWPCASAR